MAQLHNTRQWRDEHLRELHQLLARADGGQMQEYAFTFNEKEALLALLTEARKIVEIDVGNARILRTLGGTGFDVRHKKEEGNGE